ncbi:MAG: T9SS type A sorting domain-containing protein [Bacteroidota bacterium]
MKNILLTATITFFFLTLLHQNISAQALTVTGVTTPSPCNQSNSGSINITATGGTPSYFYTWSNGMNTEDASNLSAGLYCVTVTDAALATATACFTVGGFSAWIGFAPETCTGSDGIAWLNMSGGTQPISILWSTSATTDTVYNLSAGNYSVQVLDSAGCSPFGDSTGIMTFSITNNCPLPFTGVVTPATCPQLCDGSIDITVTGGSGPYTYFWSNSSTTADQFNLCAGTYTVTITDATGIPGVGTFTVGGFFVSVTTRPETCSNGDGKAWVNISGAVPPVSILWDNNLATDTVFNLSSGYHWVQVSDSSGCPTDSNYVYFNIGRTFPFTSTVSSTAYNCPIFGTATANVTGGTPPISYEWNTTPPRFTNTIDSLIPGSYSVTISDASGVGCSVVRTVNVQNASPGNISTTSTPEVCNYNNGTATVIPQSGNPPFTYLWNTVPPQMTATATNLSTGSYLANVFDVGGCIATRTVQVANTAPIQLNIQPVNETCHNDNGSITLTPLLGTPPYIYNWSNGASTASIANLSMGYYSVTVSDAEGCTVAASRYLNDITSFSVNITYTTITCLALTATATATVTGTTGPYTYRWSTTPTQTTATATGLGLGAYRLTVTDVAGCTGVFYVSIPFQNIINMSTSSNPALCNSATGSAYSFASGGTAPYTYHWSNNQNTQHITNVVPGYYSVTITDANGCSNTKSVSVGKYSNINIGISTTNASCIFINDGTATANTVNTTPPVTYQWSNGQTIQTATGLNPGWRYAVRVTDANGCSASANCIAIGYNGTSCAALASGRVINDLDRNCAVTTGDVGIPNVLVQAVPGYYDFTDGNGAYSFVLPPANYAINHVLPYHTFQLCPIGPILLFGLTAGSDTADNNFYDTVRTALDLAVSYNYSTPPRPGFSHRAHVNYHNYGNIQTSGVVEYDYDSILTFSNSVPAPSSIDLTNHKLYFNINNLAVGGQGSIRLDFTTPQTTALGTLISECVHITPVIGDVNFVNNDQCHFIEVVGSYDPNDKAVTPKGIGQEGYITRDDSVLHYTIRFQNTGTYYAQDVVVLDSLDTDLDWSSIARITTSHLDRLTYDFFQNKTLAFNFYNIFLPDSTNDEPGSHGFVSFDIKLKPNLAHGTQIKNKGAIYFDYNEPIITNEVLNTIDAPIGIEELENLVLKVFPNPTSGVVNVEFENAMPGKTKIRMQNIFGQTVKEQSIEAQTGKNIVSLLVETFASGIYFISLQNETGKPSVAKFIKE